MTNNQAAAFTAKMNEALDRQTMSWDNELKEWHRMALMALEHATPGSLQVDGSVFSLLTHQLPEGLNMNVVMVLAANMNKVSAKDLNLPLDRYCHYQKLNDKVQQRWHIMTEPTRKKILKEVELMIEQKHIIGARN